MDQERHLESSCIGLCPVPFVDIVAAPNQIAMAKIDPVALFAKDFKANWET